MEWIRLTGFCLLAAAMTMVLRQLHPSMAGLLTVAFSVLLTGLLLPEVAAYTDTIRRFLSTLQLDEQYARVMMKAMGIVLLSQLTMQICRDMEAPSVAQYAGLLGRIALLGVAVPVFMQLTEMAVDALR